MVLEEEEEDRPDSKQKENIVVNFGIAKKKRGKNMFFLFSTD